jgi:NitT/TauT family transport system substrate-binding protein
LDESGPLADARGFFFAELRAAAREEDRLAVMRWKHVALRAAATALIGTLALCLVPSRGPAQEAAKPAAGETVTHLRVGDSIDPLPLIVAIDRGYFAQQNIAVDLVRLGSAPAHIAALIGGSEDVFYGDTLAWASAVGNGLKLELFQSVNEGDAAPSGGQSTILVDPASGIKNAADLKGKQIGVTPTPLITLLTKLWLERNGVDPNAETYVPITPQLAMGTALKNKHVDAIVDGDPFTEQAEKDYGFVALGYPSREAPPGTTQAGFFSTTAYLQAHPDVAKRFAIAIREGARWANGATPEEKAAVLAKFTPIDLTALESKVPGIVNQFHYYKWHDGAVNVEATQRWVDLAVKQGVIERSIVVKDNLFPTALATTLK